MVKPVPLPPSGFDDLSVDEKIDYLQSLWERIAATPETIPVPDWHHEILDVVWVGCGGNVVAFFAFMRRRGVPR